MTGGLNKWEKQRLTSSRFEQICKRKKAVDLKFCPSLNSTKDLSKIPAIAYGLTHEALALDRFKLNVNRNAGSVRNIRTWEPPLTVLFLL